MPIHIDSKYMLGFVPYIWENVPALTIKGIVSKAFDDLLYCIPILKYVVVDSQAASQTNMNLNKFVFYLVISLHCIGVIISVMVSQITSVSIVYSTVCSGANQRKHQSSASLALVREIHWWPANSPHKRPVTRKIFPLNDVIMYLEEQASCYWYRVNSKVYKHHPSVVCFMVYVGHSNNKHVLSKTYLTGSKTRQS